MSTQTKKGNQLDSLSRVRHVAKIIPFGEGPALPDALSKGVRQCWTPELSDSPLNSTQELIVRNWGISGVVTITGGVGEILKNCERVL